MTTYDLSIDIVHADGHLQPFFIADTTNVNEAIKWCATAPLEKNMLSNIKPGYMLVARYDDELLRGRSGSPVRRVAAFGKIVARSRGKLSIASCSKDGAIGVNGKYRRYTFDSRGASGCEIVNSAGNAAPELFVYAMCECLRTIAGSSTYDEERLQFIPTAINAVSAMLTGGPAIDSIFRVKADVLLGYANHAIQDSDFEATTYTRYMFNMGKAIKHLIDAANGVSACSQVTSGNEVSYELDEMAECCQFMCEGEGKKDVVPAIIRRHVSLPEALLYHAATSEMFGLEP